MPALLSTTTCLTVVLTLSAACAPRIGNSTAPAPVAPAPATTPPTTNTFATVTVDTTVPWSTNEEDQQAASLPIDTQLRSLQSIYVHGDPKVESIMESPSKNGTRIVTQIGWNGNEVQLRTALEEAFKYNELMANFDVAMVPAKR